MSVTSRQNPKAPQKKQWRAVVNHYDIYGNRKPKTSKWFDRKADALEAERTLKASIASEKIGKAFGECCMEWIESTKDANVPKTYRDKIHMLDTYLPGLKDVKMNKITPALVKSVFDEPEVKQLGTSRKNRIRGIVNSTFKYAMAMYNFPNNPVDAIPTFSKTENEKMKQLVIYTPEQVEAMLERIDDEHDEHRRILETLYRTGMRLNECLSLTWADWIAPDRLHIWRQHLEDGWHSLKTEGSERTISLDGVTSGNIQKQYDEYKDIPGFENDWFIFGGPKPVPGNTLRKIANKAQKAAGLEHCRLHDLRHAHASYLLDSMTGGEGDILKVSRRLGHSSVKTTMDIYAHVLDKDETDIVSALDKLNSGKK